MIKPKFSVMRAINKFKNLQSLMLIFTMVMDGGCGTWLGNPNNPDDGKDPKVETPTPGQPDPTIPSSESAVNLTFQGVKPLNLLSTLQVIGKNGNPIGTLVMEKASIVLGSIEFEKADGAGVAGEIDFAGPYLVNPLDNTVTPPPAPKNLTAGLYKEIKLKMEKLEQEDAAAAGAAAADLVDRSIYIKGRFVDTAGVERAFNMYFSLDEEFKLAGKGSGIELIGGTMQNIVIAFDLPTWFNFSRQEANADSVDLGDLASSEIVLSEDSEGTEKLLHQLIKENIKESSEFGKDNNDDGELD